MDFILNSKTKKVEIFYETAAEQQAILNFMSQHLTYREDKTPSSQNIYINDPGISWASVSAAPYTVTANTDLSGIVTLNNSAYSTIDSAIDATKLESSISNSIEASIKPKEKKAYAATTLDNSSDEGGYSCLTAYVPNKAKAK